MKKFLILLLLVGALLSFGQLDPGMKAGSAFDIWQAGNKVGEIYIPARQPGVSHYDEHWVLFPDYVYPGPKNLEPVRIVPLAVSPYASQEDFFRRVPFKRGSKYIRVTADEYDQMPAAQ
jgi:hypothetical protein